MLSKYLLRNGLFIRLCTAPAAASYTDMSEPWREAWQRRIVGSAPKPEEIVDAEARLRYHHAARIPEFGRIAAITVGKFQSGGGGMKFLMRTLTAPTEAQLIDSFVGVIDRHFGATGDRGFLCGFAIKDFIVPYLVRRCFVNRLTVPPTLQVFGRKPWDLDHMLDVQDVWKAGDRDSMPSLSLIALSLGIPIPDERGDRAESRHPLGASGEVGDIARSAEAQLVCLARVFLRLSGGPDLADEFVMRTAASGEEKPVSDAPIDPLASAAA